jgi:zinc transport system ATP-binding protein
VTDSSPDIAPRRSCGACCTRLVDFGVTLRGTPVLDRINLHMHCGEMTAVIGPNGAGKTTLLRAMIGEVPHTGTLRFVHHGQNEDSQPLRIGYVPQKLELDSSAPTTVLDLFATATGRWPVWLGARRPARDAAERALSVVDAESLLHRKLCEISVGQLQRVLLALALVPVPEILLLDEPVAALDQAGIERFYETVSRLRTAYDLSILLVSHDLMAAARVADRMLLLHRTILCDGSPRDVLLSPLIRRTFGFGFTENDVAGQSPVVREITHATCPVPPGGAG